MSDALAARKIRNAMTLGQYPWMKGSRAMTGVRQMRASVRMLGRVQRMRRPLAQRLHDQLAHRLQAVDNDHDPVHTIQNERATRVVIHLTRHRVEMEPGLEAADGAEVHRQEVEEQRALGLGSKRDHLTARVGRHLTVNVLEIAGLAAQARAVVHELAVDLAGRVVDHRHGTRVLLPEEFVNFVFRPLEQALFRRRRARTHTIEHLLEDLVQLFHRAFPLELHETQGGALVEQHDEDHALGHVGEEHRLLLALVHQGGELVLADHFGKLVVGAEVGGGEGGEGGGVELRSVADGRDQLPGTVHEQRAAGVRIPKERLQVLLDLLEVVLGERPARRTRHYVPSGLSDSAMSRRAKSACAMCTPSAYSRSPPTGIPRAMRVTRTPVGLSSCCRKVAVTSPSIDGVVAMIPSRNPAPPPFATRSIKRSRCRASGPTPSSGESRPPSTW